MIKKLIQSFTIIHIIAVLSLIFLISGYFIQYFLGVLPCKLCLYQRGPYFLLILLGIVSLIKVRYFSHEVLLMLCRVLIVAEIFLALYHVGIERGIFPEIVPCQVENLIEGSISCQEVRMRIWVFSLTEVNLFLSSMLFIFTFILPYDGMIKFIHHNKKKSLDSK